MLGAILGDMIGSPYEFDRNNLKTTEFPLFCPRSRFTDDTVMTVAVSAALRETMGQDDESIRAALVRKMREFGARYPRAGYGGRFYSWLMSDDPKPYNSYGNGSAMRVSSVGWLYTKLEETVRIAALTAEVSHDHPEGIRGAEAVAAAIYLARCGTEKQGIKRFIEQAYGYDLDTTLDEIRPTYRFDVSCQGSVPQAIRAFLEGSDYESTVRLAVSIGGDSDTIACIAGSIAEACYGIPEAMEAEGLRRLRQQSEELYAQVVEMRQFCRERVGEPEDRMQDALRVSPYTTGYPAVEAAMENYGLPGGEQNVIPILSALIKAMDEGMEIILPVIFPEGFCGKELSEPEGGNAVSGEMQLHEKAEMPVQIQHLDAGDGKYWLPVFTNQQEIEKGEPTSMLPQLLRQTLEEAQKWENCAGVVINPFGAYFQIAKEGIPTLLEGKPRSSITVLQTDIAKVNADAVVDPARHDLSGAGGGVDRAIHRAAGPELKAACAKLGRCETGGAKITKGYALPARFVIHIVPPRAAAVKNEESANRFMRKLRDCYRNVLELARLRGLHSIAFPCICAGKSGLDAEIAAKLALENVAQWLDENPDHAMAVYFCCQSEETADLFRKYLLPGRMPTQDEPDLQAGVDAYRKGDYETAVMYYRRSADAGNVTALSDLGYCYYYGRSIPVDKERARDCWEAAAVLGDVCAIYKLGDLHRNGDLPVNERLARMYYELAYRRAKETRDPECYPDACLRVLKYCPDVIPAGERRSVSEEIVQMLEKRIAEGDTLSDGVLEEARQIRDRLREEER